MKQLVQLELFHDAAIYKVRWKEYEPIYDSGFGANGFYKKLIGFSSESSIRTTARKMTKAEAEGFVEHLVDFCNDYAGWHEIIET